VNRSCCLREYAGRFAVKYHTMVCLVVVLVCCASSRTGSAACSPVGTWDGVWREGMGNGPLRIVFDCDGTTKSVQQIDLRPGLGCVLTFEIETTYSFDPESCKFEIHGEDQTWCSGYTFFYSEDVVGHINGCDDANGTFETTLHAYYGGELVHSDSAEGTLKLRQMSAPSAVAEPHPADGARDRPIHVELGWSNCGGCTFDVYLGTDLGAVGQAGDPNKPPGRGTRHETRYHPGFLSHNTTYYWRVDARNHNGVTKGKVWRFRTGFPDLNGDGRVGAAEVKNLADHWLSGSCAEPDWCGQTDFDRNRDVNAIDFAILAKHWPTDVHLIGHWRMDDNAPNRMVTDSSRQGNHGNAQRDTNAMGGVGVLKGALTFNGKTDYVYLGGSGFLPSGNSARSVSAWVRTSRKSGDNIMFSYGNLGKGNVFALSAGSTQVGPGNTVCVLCRGIDWDSGYVVPRGVWTHLVVTHDGTNTRLYVNGVQEASTDAMRVDTLLDGSAFIGRLADGAGPFDGQIDDLRVYDKALTAREAAALHKPGTRVADAGAGRTPPDSNKVTITAEPPDSRLMGHWRMDDNAPNTTVVDSSGGDKSGAARRNTSVLHTAGAIGGALSFDGKTDYVSIPDRDEWRLEGDFSITLWVRFDSLGPKWWECAFVGQDEGGGRKNKWIFSYDTAGKKSIFHVNRTGAQGVMIGGDSWTAQTGRWYFVGLTRARDRFTFYRQGSAQGSASSSVTIPDVASPLTIGWAEGKNRFDGAIDDVRIYREALSMEEIASTVGGGLRGSALSRQ